jgi:hypothetical protein
MKMLAVAKNRKTEFKYEKNMNVNCLGPYYDECSASRKTGVVMQRLARVHMKTGDRLNITTSVLGIFFVASKFQHFDQAFENFMFILQIILIFQLQLC